MSADDGGKGAWGVGERLVSSGEWMCRCVEGERRAEMEDERWRTDGKEQTADD